MHTKCDICGAELIDLLTSGGVCPNNCNKVDTPLETPGFCEEPGYQQAMKETFDAISKWSFEVVDAETKETILKGDTHLKNPSLEATLDRKWGVGSKTSIHQYELPEPYKRCWGCSGRDSVYLMHLKHRVRVGCYNCGIHAGAMPTEKEAIAEWGRLHDRRNWKQTHEWPCHKTWDERKKESLKEALQKGMISINSFISQLHVIFAEECKQILDNKGFLTPEIKDLLTPVKESEKIDKEDFKAINWSEEKFFWPPPGVTTCLEHNKIIDKDMIKKLIEQTEQRILQEYENMFYCEPNPNEHKKS